HDGELHLREPAEAGMRAAAPAPRAGAQAAENLRDCMKRSKPASVNWNQRLASVRNLEKSAKIFFQSSFLPFSSLYSASDCLKASAMISVENGRSLVPCATSWRSAPGLRAS